MLKASKYKNQKVAVFGLGKTGIASTRALLDGGAEVFAWDDNEQARQKLLDLKLENSAKLKVLDPNQYNWNEIVLLVLSAGIPFTHPKPNYVVELARSCPIICDVELLYEHVPNATYIGITGTNGKSTTTSLIGHIVQQAGIDTEIGGNLGFSCADFRELSSTGVYVIEMSSYQLDLVHKTHFNVAILLNITPDHLERHGGMAGYIKAKERIFANQNNNDMAVFGIDCDNAREVYERLKKIAPSKVIGVSYQEKVKGGIAVINGVIYDDINKKEINLGTLKRLAGNHNAQNIGAAYAAAQFLGIDDDTIEKSIKSFVGLPHRMEYLGEHNGVTFVNDSKATNAESTSKALLAYDNIYWIAGGVAKDGGIKSLESLFPKIKCAYLIGNAQDDFASSLEGKIPYKKCDTIDNAFKESYSDAQKNSRPKPVIMLSPACASFDQWPNFEVRGEYFCNLVKEVLKSEA